MADYLRALRSGGAKPRRSSRQAKRVEAALDNGAAYAEECEEGKEEEATTPSIPKPTTGVRERPDTSVARTFELLAAAARSRALLRKLEPQQ